jgi:F-type H+-transporting ATPase subunit alpha
MDDIPIEDVKRFELELREYFRIRHGDLLSDIRESGKIPEGDELVDGITAFKETFETSEVEE